MIMFERSGGVIMDTKLKDIESKEEVELILNRFEEVKNGNFMTIDDSIKAFIDERQLWKSLA